MASVVHSAGMGPARSPAPWSSAQDHILQRHGLVVRFVCCAEHEGHVLLLRAFRDRHEIRPLACRQELVAVPPAEFLPLLRIVAEPLPEGVARREVLSPLVNMSPLLREPARPDAVDEDSPTILLRGRFVHAL